MPETDGLIEVDASDHTDPNNRVHHHARIRNGEREIITLCGLLLKGKRRDAADMPCCPMCNLEMGLAGRSCT